MSRVEHLATRERRNLESAMSEHKPRVSVAWMTDKMREAIAQRDAMRGRSLTEHERLMNLTAAMGECDSDCASRRGNYCDCGAQKFKAKFGPGKHTP